MNASQTISARAGRKTIRKAVVAGFFSLAALAGMVVVPSQAAAAPHHFGAIAISVRTGNAAYAIDYGSPAAARNAAIARCGAFDCRWVVTMDNNCGAASQQPRTRRWGWAYAPTRGGAERAASNAAGPRSRTVVWACTTRPRG